jgi:anti-anti-sigma factor
MPLHLDPPPLQEEADDEVTVVHFAGRNVWLVEETLPHIHGQLFALATGPRRADVLLDFGNVEYLSNLALDTLVSLHKKLLAGGRHLSLRNLSPQVLEVFTVVKLDRLLDLRPADNGWALSQGCPTGPPMGVLVVDDDDAVRAVLEIGLRSRGFEVQVAAHGQQAVELYRRQRNEIAVVLLDVLMPGLDGPHTLAALQQLSPNVRCCFMTGNLGPHTEDNLLQMGAVRVFRKPFALTEVLDTLEQLASRSSRRRRDQWIEIPLLRSVKDAGIESQAG